jgi:glycosyltransferase involved in cell wall biosynthesis
MKLLVVASQLGVLRGGGECFTRNLFTEFVKRGHQVSVAFVADSKGRYPYSIPASMEPIVLPGWWSRKFGQATLSKIGEYIPSNSCLKTAWDRGQEALCWRTIRWNDVRMQRRIERDFANRWQDFDAVYVQGNALLARCVASFRPTVLMLPGPVGPNLEPVLRAVHAVCAHDDALIRVREFLGDHVLELPLGISSHLFTPGSTPVRSHLGWTNKDMVIGYVGRLTHLKGIDLLSGAFGEVLHNFPNIKLLFVGSGEMERHLRSVLANALERGMVHIEPAMPQELLAPWYQTMDLMVMPSRYETMSSAVLEAMACGVPFLASDVGGNSTLGNTGAGWLFQAGSTSSLSESLSSIIRNPSEIKARGALAPSYVRERHSWTVSAERLEFIMESRLGVTRKSSWE